MNPVDGRLTSLSLNYSLNKVPFWLSLSTIIIYFFELKSSTSIYMLLVKHVLKFLQVDYNLTHLILHKCNLHESTVSLIDMHTGGLYLKKLKIRKSAFKKKR